MGALLPIAHGDRSIKELLADQGIEVRKVGDGPSRELWRGDEFLGHFTAGASVAAFLTAQPASPTPQIHSQDIP